MVPASMRIFFVLFVLSPAFCLIKTIHHDPDIVKQDKSLSRFNKKYRTRLILVVCPDKVF
jgi:hypothetical protein